jgi:serine/threonine-protein kinase
VGGTYYVRRLIGRGGMGEVYLAEDKGGHRVALKMLNDVMANDARVVERFKREATIARLILSPYVVRLENAGSHEDRLWIAFEYLVGESLDRRLQQDTSLPFDEVARIVDQPLQGLRVAHDLNVVHRDIKPGNLFIEARGQASSGARDDAGRVCILDFGISKFRSSIVGQPTQALTTADSVLGTTGYMPPEQLEAPESVDARADLYALATVAFKALTGRLPCDGESPALIMAFKRKRDPHSLAAVTGMLWPEEAEAFFARALARERDRRFVNATEMLAGWRDLCRLRDRLPISTRKPSSLADEDTLRDAAGTGDAVD